MSELNDSLLAFFFNLDNEVSLKRHRISLFFRPLKSLGGGEGMCYTKGKRHTVLPFEQTLTFI